MDFCVIRHPAAGIGTCPRSALDLHKATGWIRVSNFSADPTDFDLAALADAPDLDAPAPTVPPADKPTKTKES